MRARRRVLRLDLEKGKGEWEEDLVAVDRSVLLVVNGFPLTVLPSSPRNLRELALGHLLGEGVISSPEEVKGVRVRGERVEVRLRGEGRMEALDPLEAVERLPRPPPTSFDPAVLLEPFRSLLPRSPVFRSTGGTHVAALVTREGEVVARMEDVSRHGAVDKVLGRGLMLGADFSSSFLALSGRVGEEVVVKALRAGIPLVASKAAPLLSGILAAEAGGLTLVCFARGSRLNVYTHPERVAGKAGG